MIIDGNEENEENQKSLFLPYDLPEIHATGAAVATGPFSLRLLLINEEIDRNDDFIVDDTIKVIKSAVGEIILHPAVAKQISELLSKEVKNYESVYGKLPEV